MRSALKHNQVFISLFLFWLVIGAFVLLTIDKGSFVIYFNENRTILGNLYFSIASRFAEYSFILFFLAFLLNKSFGNTFITALIWLFSGIAAQSLKRIFEMPRPAAFFDENILNFIGDGNLYYAHSFPSGHTTTAFALFFAFALFTNNKKWQILFFFCALSTAFARLYLLQHFFIDVYFGSILGVLVSILVFVSINSSNIFGFQSWKNKKLGLKRLF